MPASALRDVLVVFPVVEEALQSAVGERMIQQLQHGVERHRGHVRAGEKYSVQFVRIPSLAIVLSALMPSLMSGILTTTLSWILDRACAYSIMPSESVAVTSADMSASTILQISKTRL